MVRLSKKLQDRMRIHKNKLFANDYKKVLESRPELDVVNYQNGHIEIANTYVAIRAKDVLKKEHEIENERYPDINHIFDIHKSDTLFQSSVNPKELEDLTLATIDECDMLEFKYRPSKSGDVLTLIPQTKDTIITITPMAVNVTIDIEPVTKNDEIKFILDPLLFNDAMNFFRMLGADSVDVITEGPNKPIHLVYENIHYVIAPITNRNKRY